MSTGAYGRGFRPASTLAKRLFSARARKLGAVIPEAQWEPFDLKPAGMVIKDQNGFGACAGHACASSLQFVRSMAGMTEVQLSAWFAYSILCNGVDRGASIADALTLAEGTGVAPEALVPYGTINPRALSQEAYEAANLRRIDAGTMVAAWADIVTGVIRRDAFNLSVDSGGWERLDAEGVPPLGSQADHAITIAGGLKHSAKWGWLVKGWNSWGAKWGQDGTFWLSQKHIQVKWFEAYHVVAAVDNPDDPTTPPA